MGLKVADDIESVRCYILIATALETSDIESGPNWKVSKVDCRTKVDDLESL